MQGDPGMLPQPGLDLDGTYLDAKELLTQSLGLLPFQKLGEDPQKIQPACESDRLSAVRDQRPLWRIQLLHRDLDLHSSTVLGSASKDIRRTTDVRADPKPGSKPISFVDAWSSPSSQSMSSEVSAFDVFKREGSPEQDGSRVPHSRAKPTWTVPRGSPRPDVVRGRSPTAAGCQGEKSVISRMFRTGPA